MIVHKSTLRHVSFNIVHQGGIYKTRVWYDANGNLSYCNVKHYDTALKLATINYNNFTKPKSHLVILDSADSLLFIKRAGIKFKQLTDYVIEVF